MNEVFILKQRVLESIENIKPGTLIRTPRADGTFSDMTIPVLVTDASIPKVYKGEDYRITCVYLETGQMADFITKLGTKVQVVGQFEFKGGKH